MNSKFPKLLLEMMIENIYNSNDYCNQVYITKSLLAIHLFDNKEEEMEKDFFPLVGLFTVLINLVIEMAELDLDIEHLNLRCEVCKNKILSSKIINCKNCGMESNELYSCVSCIPWLYDNYDPYLCDSCTQ